MAVNVIRNNPATGRREEISVIEVAAVAGGDLVGNYPNPTLAAVGGGAGTFATPSSVTVDAKGRVTSITAGAGGGGGGTTFTANQSTGSTIATNKAVAWASSGNVRLADSGAVNDYPVIGFTTGAITTGGSGTIQAGGLLTGFSGLTAGALYFSDPSAPGAITATPPSTINQKSQFVGTAISATSLEIMIEPPITITGIGTGTNNITLANDQGAIVKQATTGTPQSGANINIDGVVSSLEIDTTGDVNVGGEIVGQGGINVLNDISGNNLYVNFVNSANVNATSKVQINSVNINPVPKNWVINGNMDVCQRFGPLGSSVIAIGKAYLIDRFYHLRDGASSVVTASQQAFTQGQTAVPGEPKYYLRHNQTVAGTGMATNIIDNYVEDVAVLAGQAATISFWGKADAARSVTFTLYQVFGVSGGGSAAVVAVTSACAFTTSWQQFTFSMTMPSIAGKTIVANANGLLLRWAMPLNATGTFDFAQVQLEAGLNAGPFQKKSFPEEQLLCQRYFQKSFPYATPVAQNCGSVVNAARVMTIVGGVVITQGADRLAIPMRAVPAVTFYNPLAANAFARNNTAGTDATATSTVGVLGESQVGWQATGLAAWAANQVVLVHWGAEADF